MATSDGLENKFILPTEAGEPCTTTSYSNCHLLTERSYKRRSNGNLDAIQSYLTNNLTNCSKDDSKKYLALLADYIQLKAEKQNIEDYNKRLLSYSTQKDAYMNKLIQETKELKCPSNETNSLSELNNITISQNKYVKMYEELQAKNREINLLKKQIEKMKTEFQEDTEVLKMQLRAHRDDWEAERSEKVLVENREIQLQEKLHTMEIKIKELQQHILENEGCKCMCHHSNSGYGSHSEPIIRNYQLSNPLNSYYGSSARLIPRSSNENLAISTSDLVCDGVTEESPKVKNELKSPLTFASTTPAIKSKKKDDISCPDCGKVFPKHVHLHFLEHFERCHRRTL